MKYQVPTNTNVAFVLVSEMEKNPRFINRYMYYYSIRMIAWIIAVKAE